MKQLTALAVSQHTCKANVARQATASCEHQHLAIKCQNFIDQIDCRLEPT